MNDRVDGRNEQMVMEPSPISLTPEEVNFLEKEGYAIFELSGKSLRQLVAEGLRVDQDWLEHYPAFFDEPSSKATIAFRPSHFYLLDEGGSSPQRLAAYLDEYSHELKEGLPSLKSDILRVADYAQVGRDFFEKTGASIFRQGQLEYAVTRSKTSPSFDISVGMIGNGALDLYQWPNPPGNYRVGLAPLIMHDPRAVVGR